MPRTKPITVADYLARAIELSGRPQKEIASEVGFPHPNVLSMMKQGMTKVPLERAPALARALRVDPAHFVRLAMREYWPAAWAAIEGTLGETLTANERRLVDAYRGISGEGEREVDDAVVAALRRALTGQR